MNDCCSNYGYSEKPTLTVDQFECVNLHEIVKNNAVYGVTLVTKCSPEWDHNFTRALCEAESNMNDIILRLPVSDKTLFHVMYKNMYCAQCNFVEDFYYWTHEIKCRNETGVRSLSKTKDCLNHFKRPNPDYSYRTCRLSQSIISVCNQTTGITSYEIIKECKDGIYAVTFDMSGTMYRNKHCAVCNGVSEDSLLCEYLDDDVITIDSNSRLSLYSLALTVNINTGKAYRNEKEEDVKQCKKNEVYVNHFQKCREIHCAPSLVPLKGKCISKISNTFKIMKLNHDLGHVTQENCTFIKVESKEYKFINKTLFIHSHNKHYSTEKYHVKGNSVFICVNESQTCANDCKTSKYVSYTDIVESDLTLLCLVVSILSLAVTLAVYVAFPQLLNVPGKILVSLIISLLFAHVLFLVASQVENFHILCIIFGILVHYFFLAAFCWMNVIAFDLWMTFSNRFMTPGSDSKGRKRFVRYSIYAWTLPTMIVGTALILDFVNFDEKFYNFKPGYGKNVCWISSRDALILFFAGPLAVFKLLDIISFISTAVHIARAKKEGAMATRRKNTCSFIINIKLSLIMGLTWVFAFVANALNKSYMWYLFIIFNSLQGLFIAICFLCTKVVCRLLCEKYRQLTERNTSGTHITSVP
ncbi:adhesion G protein-coupled receptor E3-like [Ruditapes philippinarum]|uniref:adhesion G protein-coupled receptor E3-like n=1 Tax=Ruditapes philippinarum TaxID=129788 RepID=UPI00295BD92C|nr:adhesion G protein-coupled receptor E3-like [Ruditapes philippinarum]